MTDETHATLRASASKFSQMIRESALDGDTEHGDLYLNILEDEVEILQSAPGEVVLTYDTYGEDYFDEIELERDEREVEATDNSGNDFEFTIGAEAILDVADTLTYLGMATEGGTVELSFTGSEDRRLSTYVRAEGALQAWVRLPGSEDTIDEVPHWLRLRFDDDGNYCNKSGDAAPTNIETKVDKITTIVEAVKNDRDAEFRPIRVEDGDFKIDVGDDSRSGVRGVLGAQKVEGPDVENYYFDGFDEIFNVLSGPVELQTAPGNAPLCVTQSESNGKTIRHINGSVNN